MFESKTLHKLQHLLVPFSQRIGERSLGHLVYQPCNTTVSLVIRHVKTKDNLIKTNTQMICTDECMHMCTQLL